MSSHQTQFHAFMRHLFVARRHGIVRPIVVIKRSAYAGTDKNLPLSKALPWGRMKAVTGYDFQIAKLGGRGAKFVAQKRAFDDPATPPTALVCDGVDHSFLVGADLCWADAIFMVGSWHTELRTQALGRVLRPNQHRARRAIPIFLLTAR